MAKKIPKIIKEILKNPPQEINYAFQKNISYSKMSIFRSCPFRWKLQYKDKIKRFTSSIHTVFGSAVHETMQAYLDVMYTETGAAADRLDLEDDFHYHFTEEYKKQYKANNNQHFSSAEEMREFFNDGIGILNWFKKKKSAYFSKRGWHLVGCEVPIVMAPNLRLNRVKYMGYLDVVMYHEPTNTFKIIDIKTSTKGWNKWNKKDESKQFQLILYKYFFSKQYNIPIENIDIEFFIVRRKIYVDGDYPQKRVQQFIPASGKVKLNKATTNLNEFISKAFNLDGSYKDTIFRANPSKWNCTFCPYKTNTELCNAVGKNL